MNLEILSKQIHYNPETGEFRRLVRGAPGNRIVGCRIKNYLSYRCRVDKKPYLLHRIAFLFMGEEVPNMVDHINGNGSDNRWCNLRPATSSQNQQNKGKLPNNTSGMKNVRAYGKGRWLVRVECPDGIYAESFETLEEAKEAATRARISLHGEFANHN